MVDDEKRYSIEEIIELCKIAPIIIVGRQKNREFLQKTLHNSTDVIDEIRSLRVEYACADAELDNGINRKGYVYQFKKLIFEKYWCYIKLKVKISNKKRQLILVISFHEEDTNYEKKQG